MISSGLAEVEPAAAGTRLSPYVGLVPYTEADAAFFFGRDRDTRLIQANLFASPLTLLYGPSGVGKSSVLRAGLVHQSRSRGDVLVVMFSRWQTDPLQGLRGVFAGVAGADAEGPLAQYLSDVAEQSNKRLMIVLDQFEEYFLYHPAGDEFGTQFSAATRQPDLPVSFLISIREDALAKLDRFEGHIPGLFDNYLRLEHLEREAAAEAITRPIQEYNRLFSNNGQAVEVDPELVREVLKQVATEQAGGGEAGPQFKHADGAGDRVDASYLQIVMTRLWDEELRGGSHVLRLETLQRLGNAEDILQTHLDSALNALPAEAQDIAAAVFVYLVTASGGKIALSAKDLARWTGLQRSEIERVMNELARPNVRILRSVAPLGRQTEVRYEIHHDRLAPAISSWPERHRHKRELEQFQLERQRAEEERAEAERKLVEERAAFRRKWTEVVLITTWTLLFWMVTSFCWLAIAPALYKVLGGVAGSVALIVSAVAGGVTVSLTVRARVQDVAKRVESSGSLSRFQLFEIATVWCVGGIVIGYLISFFFGGGLAQLVNALLGGARAFQLVLFGSRVDVVIPWLPVTLPAGTMAAIGFGALIGAVVVHAIVAARSTFGEIERVHASVVSGAGFLEPSLPERALAAWVPRRWFYFMVAVSPDTTWQAFVVVALAGAVVGLKDSTRFYGPIFLNDLMDWPKTRAALGDYLVFNTLATLALWLLASVVSWFIGTRLLRGSGPLIRQLRTLGFAFSPCLLWLFGVSMDFSVWLPVVIYPLQFAGCVLATSAALGIRLWKSLLLWTAGAVLAGLVLGILLLVAMLSFAT